VTIRIKRYPKSTWPTGFRQGAQRRPRLAAGLGVVLALAGSLMWMAWRAGGPVARHEVVLALPAGEVGR